MTRGSVALKRAMQRRAEQASASRAFPTPISSRATQALSTPRGSVALKLAIQHVAERASASSTSSAPVSPRADPVLPTTRGPVASKLATQRAAERAFAPFILSASVSSRATQALSTPRGSVALKLAMQRAAEARTQMPAPFVAPPVEPAKVRPVAWFRRRRTLLAAACALALACLGGGLFALWHTQSIQQWTHPPAWRLTTAREWWEHARQRAEAGDFRLALGTVRYALALDPDDAVLLRFQGDMEESLLQFREAQASYERVLAVNPDDRAARQNLVLCRRINRRRDGTVRPGTLYNLHRVMLEQGRVAEALAITRRLADDRDLQCATWQAALENTGLAGRITVDADGALELDLAGNTRPDLSLIRSFPLTGLNLAGTGVEDLGALRGMMLKRLDLSRTLVYDLEPLRGMPLQTLQLAHTGVVDLGAIAACPLRDLDISGTRVPGLEALARLPLETLRADETPVADLRPLAALPLRGLWLGHTRVTDLEPLTHLGLETLVLDGTAVADLSPLTGCPLRELSLAATRVSDLRPLAGMPLNTLTLAGCAVSLDLSPLASCAWLEHLVLPLQPRSRERLAGLPRLKFIR